MRMLPSGLPVLILVPLLTIGFGPQTATLAWAIERRGVSPGLDSGRAAAEEVVALEKRTWETAQRHDISGYAGLLSDDFTLVNETGISDKKQVVDSLDGLTIHRYRLSDVKLHNFSPNALMITYRVNVKLSFRGKVSEGDSYRSSLWVRRQGRWLNVFYQASDSR